MSFKELMTSMKKELRKSDNTEILVFFENQIDHSKLNQFLTIDKIFIPPKQDTKQEISMFISSFLNMSARFGPKKEKTPDMLVVLPETFPLF